MGMDRSRTYNAAKIHMVGMNGCHFSVAWLMVRAGCMHQCTAIWQS